MRWHSIISSGVWAFCTLTSSEHADAEGECRPCLGDTAAMRRWRGAQQPDLMEALVLSCLHRHATGWGVGHRLVQASDALRILIHSHSCSRLFQAPLLADHIRLSQSTKDTSSDDNVDCIGGAALLQHIPHVYTARYEFQPQAQSWAPSASRPRCRARFVFL
jgi:hypothetical protein